MTPSNPSPRDMTLDQFGALSGRLMERLPKALRSLDPILRQRLIECPILLEEHLRRMFLLPRVHSEYSFIVSGARRLSDAYLVEVLPGLSSETIIDCMSGAGYFPAVLDELEDFLKRYPWPQVMGEAVIALGTSRSLNDVNFQVAGIKPNFEKRPELIWLQDYNARKLDQCADGWPEGYRFLCLKLPR